MGFEAVVNPVHFRNLFSALARAVRAKGDLLALSIHAVDDQLHARVVCQPATALTLSIPAKVIQEGMLSLRKDAFSYLAKIARGHITTKQPTLNKVFLSGDEYRVFVAQGSREHRVPISEAGFYMVPVPRELVFTTRYIDFKRAMAGLGRFVHPNHRHANMPQHRETYWRYEPEDKMLRCYVSPEAGVARVNIIGSNVREKPFNWSVSARQVRAMAAAFGGDHQWARTVSFYVDEDWKHFRIEGEDFDFTAPLGSVSDPFVLENWLSLRPAGDIQVSTVCSDLVLDVKRVLVIAERKEIPMAEFQILSDEKGRKFISLAAEHEITASSFTARVDDDGAVPYKVSGQINVQHLFKALVTVADWGNRVQIYVDAVNRIVTITGTPPNAPSINLILYH